MFNVTYLYKYFLFTNKDLKFFISNKLFFDSLLLLKFFKSRFLLIKKCGMVYGYNFVLPNFYASLGASVKLEVPFKRESHYSKRVQKSLILAKSSIVTGFGKNFMDYIMLIRSAWSRGAVSSSLNLIVNSFKLVRQLRAIFYVSDIVLPMLKNRISTVSSGFYLLSFLFAKIFNIKLHLSWWSFFKIFSVVNKRNFLWYCRSIKRMVYGFKSFQKLSHRFLKILNIYRVSWVFLFYITIGFFLLGVCKVDYLYYIFFLSFQKFELYQQAGGLAYNLRLTRLSYFNLVIKGFFKKFLYFGFFFFFKLKNFILPLESFCFLYDFSLIVFSKFVWSFILFFFFFKRIYGKLFVFFHRRTVFFSKKMLSIVRWFPKGRKLAKSRVLKSFIRSLAMLSRYFYFRYGLRLLGLFNFFVRKGFTRFKFRRILRTRKYFYGLLFKKLAFNIKMRLKRRNLRRALASRVRLRVPRLRRGLRGMVLSRR